MNTSHSLLVSSTNLSFSYVALSSFFSPLAPLLPSPPLLFVQSTYSSLAKTDRGNGQSNTFIPSKRGNLQIPPILFQASLSIVLIFLSSFFFSFDRFSIFRPIHFFFFFSTNSSARVDQSRRKKQKKKRKRKRKVIVRSIILSSRFGHSMIIPYLFLKKKIFFYPACVSTGHRRSAGRTMDARTIFRFFSRMRDIFLACPILIGEG